MLSIRLALTLVVALSLQNVASAQARRAPLTREQAEAILAKRIGGNAKTYYAIALVEVTPDTTRAAAQGAGFLLDAVSLPLQAIIAWSDPRHPRPFWASRAANAVLGPPKPVPVHVEIAVFDGRKEAAEAIVAHLMGPIGAENNRVRQFSLIKKTLSRQAAIRSANGERDKLAKNRNREIILKVERRDDPPPR